MEKEKRMRKKNDIETYTNGKLIQFNSTMYRIYALPFIFIQSKGKLVSIDGEWEQ